MTTMLKARGELLWKTFVKICQRESFPATFLCADRGIMNGLRTYYNTQHNKVLSNKSSGNGTDSVYKVRWQFYDSLDFPQEMVTPRRTFSNMEEDDGPEPLDKQVYRKTKRKGMTQAIS